MTTTASKAQSKRRAEKNLVLVEIPKAYREWFKAYAAKDGSTLGAAINAALEMFMEREGGLK